VNHEAQIANLLYRYAELMDGGKLDDVAALFTHAQIMLGGQDQPSEYRALRQTWDDFVILYPCGTPRTKHLVTNPIIEIDSDERHASCRSNYTVLQSTDKLPLQIIASGRYEDRFERVDGVWRFSFRDYRLLDFVGDLSQHLKLPVPA
jgi:3-phenylpropionate/cinnamic acid dioxygenase small subunit